MARSLASPWVEAQRRHLCFPAGATALDLGCGRGRHSRLLQQLGFAVTAVDRDAPQLQLPDLHLVQRDVEQQGVEDLGDFDVVLVVNYAARELLPRQLEGPFWMPFGSRNGLFSMVFRGVSWLLRAFEASGAPEARRPADL